MASDRVVGFATRAFPSRNMWWIVLEMEDGEKQEVAVPTGADLGAMCDILRRARLVTYSVDGGIIHTPSEPIGGGAG